MTYATARVMDSAQIPVIDISALRDGSDPAGVARALHAASTGLGFIYITGHGVPDSAIEHARAAAYGFFRLSPDEKEHVRVSARIAAGWQRAARKCRTTPRRI